MQSLFILITFIHNSISYNYFIDTYDDANEGIIYLPYPTGWCTLTGNHDTPEYYWYECNSNGIYVCGSGEDDTCQQNGPCQPGLSTVTTTYTLPSQVTTNSLYYGECPDGFSTRNRNYTQISLYVSSNSNNDGCPDSNDFTEDGTIYLATNICVQQSDSSYLKVTCNGFTAEIDKYNDNNCTQFNSTIIQYTRLCDSYTGSMYRRLEGCYIDGANQLEPTPNPTNAPSVDPTNDPSIDPTVDPTRDPTTDPTNNPTVEPTVYPTYYPSQEPTLYPTSLPTTISPTMGIDPVNTLPQTASVISDFDNVTLLYLIFGVLFVFYLFICMYIWCNERRKRWHLTDNFQQENDIDKENRMKYMKQHQFAINGNANSVELEQQQQQQNDDIPQNFVYLGDGGDDNYGHREALMNEGVHNFID